MSMAPVVMRPLDGILARYGNQLGAVGQGQAKRVFVRAVNRVTTSVRSRVTRAVARQSSIPRALVNRAVRRRLASFKSLSVEGAVFATGGPLSLKYFRARQLTYGVRAKVQAEWKRYPGAFMGPRPGVLAPSLHGHVFVRTTDRRLPIEKLFGPSVPEELVTGESAKEFERTVNSMLPQRVAHELGRLLPG